MTSCGFLGGDGMRVRMKRSGMGDDEGRRENSEALCGKSEWKTFQQAPKLRNRC